MAKSDAKRGLYIKYHVERLNDPTGKHRDCEMKVGDTVRLKDGRLKATVQKIKGDSVLLDKRLRDFQWWHKDDLVVIRHRSDRGAKA